MAKGSLRVNGIIVDTDGEITASTGDSIVIREDDGSAVITVDTNGNVGINTTAPGAQFDIRGPAGTGSASASVLRMSTAETSVEDADQLGRIEFIAPLEAGGTDAILVGASIHAEADDTFAADNNATELVFSTGASEAATEKVRIASDGKVGIGTTAPDVPLHVATSTVNVGQIIQGSYDNNANPNLTFHKSNGTIASPTAITSGHMNGQIRFASYDGNSYHTSADIYCITSGTVADGRVAGNLVFRTAPDSVSGVSERMRITSNGYVGIGTTAPAELLEVSENGTTTVRIRNTSNSGYAQLVLGTGSSASAFTAIRLERTAADQGKLHITEPDGTGSNDALTIDHTGKVGIGTTSPGDLLHIAAANPVLRIENTDDSGVGAIEFWDSQSGTSVSGSISYDDVSNTFKIQGNANGIRFFQSNTFPAADSSEAMRINNSGQLLIGKDTNSITTAGVAISNTLGVRSVVDGDKGLLINRLTSDGTLIELRKDGATGGLIGTNGSASWIVLNTNSTNGIGLYGSTSGGGSLLPTDGSGVTDDNNKDIGRSDVRWDNIWATNDVIQTSDINEKQDIEELTEAEQRVAVVAKGLFRKYRWKSAVEKKGDDARIHFGIIAQDLKSAFEAEGLDAGRYAMFIRSEWWESGDNIYHKEEEAPEGAVKKERLGIRYSELLAFIVSAI